MPQLVLEIGVEEMPARFLDDLCDQLKRITAQGLLDSKIDYGTIFAWATPRRLAVMVHDVEAMQRAEEEEVTGPPAKVAFDEGGNPTKAALGFAKGQGAGPDDLYTVSTSKGDYVALRKKTGGGRTLDVLPAVLTKSVEKLSFPKKMRWGSRDFAFGRPICWLLALLGPDVVPFELAGLTSGRLTHGHRVMGPGPFEVDAAENYLEVLSDKAKVVLDPARRMEIIREQGDRLAEEAGGAVVWNDRLMQEVSGLVEWPVPILGRFDDLYLELPSEVLLTSMEKHQKSFGLEAGEGKLLPHFLTVLNIEPKDRALVRKGWERVLKARLEDARFFWTTDLDQGFDDWLAELDNVVFLKPLGSMGDKSRRIEKLCNYLAREVEPEALGEMTMAGLYCKCDLVSEMVGEFDDLQGKMGGIYARRKGMAETTAQAIYEQYLPEGPESPTPVTRHGALLAMADKLDTLAGCFGLNMIPGGAADPYALRRAALGVCRILVDHSLRFGLDGLIDKAVQGYAGVQLKLSAREIHDKLMDFFAARLKALYTGRGVETLVVEACLGAGFSDVKAFAMRLEALDEFSRRPDFEQSVLTFKRAANIIRKQGDEAGVELTGAYDADMLAEPQEKELARRIEEVSPRFEQSWARDEYGELLNLLGELRPAVDDFFDNVMVMCDDEKLRRNRLELLESLVSMLGRLADFNALQM